MKKVIDVEVIEIDKVIENEPVSQDLDRSGRFEGAREQDRENPSIDPSAPKS